LIVRFWKWFWSPTKKFTWGAILIAGGLGGMILLGGFNAAMEEFNTLEFCVSCHEMEQLVFKEYKKTIHYANRTGVRVTCADCHVPRSRLPQAQERPQLHPNRRLVQFLARWPYDPTAKVVPAQWGSISGAL